LLKTNNKTATKKASQEWSNRPPKALSWFFLLAMRPSNISLRMASISKRLAANHLFERIIQAKTGATTNLNMLKELARVRKVFT
jgi:hypothetical protein